MGICGEGLNKTEMPYFYYPLSCGCPDIASTVSLKVSVFLCGNVNMRSCESFPAVKKCKYMLMYTSRINENVIKIPIISVRWKLSNVIIVIVLFILITQYLRSRCTP